MPNTTQASSHKKTLSILLLTMVVIAFVAIYFGIAQHQQKIRPSDIKIEGAYLSPAKEISDFRLTTNEGKSFSKDNLKGHWTLMFFGFTNCGVVCPTTMSNLNKMYKVLEKDLPENKMPHILMVTVDPERDTVDQMNSYVHTFNPHFMGATGEPNDLIALEKQLHIVAVKVQVDKEDPEDYYYDHSAEILLINPEGKVQAYLSYPHKPEQLAKDYKLMLTASTS